MTMLEFLAENWGNLLVGGLLLAAVVFVVIKLIKEGGRGKSSCCSDCSKCRGCTNEKEGKRK